MQNNSITSSSSVSLLSLLPRSLLGSLSLGGALSLRVWPGVGDWELAEDTGLARSAYISSESALRTELLLEEADDTDDTLLTDRDLHHAQTHTEKNHYTHAKNNIIYLSYKLENKL